MSLHERFEAKYTKSDSCWEWLAGRTKDGYGSFRLGSRKERAHRVSYVLHHGYLPPTLCVLHHCDNRLCVRPDHLFLGTQADNTADKVQKGRQARGAAIAAGRRSYRGEASPKAKLTQVQVDAIRADSRIHRVIAAEYGVTRGAISHAKRGHTWGHV